ncbi:MAG: hypothetical protein H8D52_03485 [Gammaproteobacteria bacterium]|nr:hypothetical protein [Gammaproteobacteria bacterium]
MSISALLIMGYITIAVLLLLTLIWAPYGTRFKIASIIIVSCFYIAKFKGIETLMGWPTTATPPEVFRTVWINIEDPDKLNRTPGAIYYWLRDLDEAGIPSTAPRAYRVEWSVQSAVIAQEALGRLEKGERLNGRLSRNILKESNSDTQKQQSLGNKALPEQELDRSSFEFTAVSAPTLPLKPGPESQLRY